MSNSDDRGWKRGENDRYTFTVRKSEPFCSLRPTQTPHSCNDKKSRCTLTHRESNRRSSLFTIFHVYLFCLVQVMREVYTVNDTKGGRRKKDREGILPVSWKQVFFPLYSCLPDKLIVSHHITTINDSLLHLLSSSLRGLPNLLQSAFPAQVQSVQGYALTSVECDK